MSRIAHDLLHAAVLHDQQSDLLILALLEYRAVAVVSHLQQHIRCVGKHQLYVLWHTCVRCVIMQGLPLPGPLEPDYSTLRMQGYWLPRQIQDQHRHLHPSLPGVVRAC